LASTSERTELLEVLQIRTGRGPCVECYRTGAAQTIPQIAAETARWPRFTPLAVDQGYRSVHAVSMRGGGELVEVAAAGDGEGVLDSRPTLSVRAGDWPPFMEPAIIAMALSRKPWGVAIFANSQGAPGTDNTRCWS
jgi:hypothetical protein